MQETNNSKPLFQPITIGDLSLRNRIAMAALTRQRADYETGIPNELHVQYYTERAEEAAFVLTECTGISRAGNSFEGACEIYNDSHVEGWKKVTESVHKVNGKIILQIWHGGRTAKSSYTGVKPLAPSKIPLRNFDYKNNMAISYSEDPEELTEEKILEILEEFRKGAENALKAGFDGIELHGANGYLINQFLCDSTNQRNDKYGGSIENRCRFPILVIEALIDVFGAGRVGIKLSPIGRYNDMFDSNPLELFSYLLQELSKRKIAFVELVSNEFFDGAPVKGKDQIPDVLRDLRKHFNGALIGNFNIDFEKGNQLVEEGVVDLVTFGRLFLANPDLVSRFKNGWGFNELRYQYCYTPGSLGYTDYPKYQNI